MPRTLPKFLTQEEQELFVRRLTHLYYDFKSSKAMKRNIVMTLLCLECGLRCQEVVDIRMCDIDVNKHIIKIKGKFGHERYVGIPIALWGMLQDYSRVRYGVKIINSENVLMFNRPNSSNYTNPITTRLLRREVKKLGKMCGLSQEIHPHLLRHSFATTFYDETRNLAWLSKVLGHAGLQSTQIYTHCIVDDAIQHMTDRRWSNGQLRDSMAI